MRQQFAQFLKARIESDPAILFVTADLGYGLFDEIQQSYPYNFLNCGAAEHLMISMCVGACYEGRKPVAYSITPFLLCRPFEVIRNYVAKEQLNIKLIGSGRGKDYAHDGFSHWAEDDGAVMAALNIQKRWPTVESLHDDLTEAFDSSRPYYINLKR